MVSETDRTKRALVSLLKTLAGIYAVTLNVTRESSDKDVSSAYRALQLFLYVVKPLIAGTKVP